MRVNDERCAQLDPAETLWEPSWRKVGTLQQLDGAGAADGGADDDGGAHGGGDDDDDGVLMALMLLVVLMVVMMVLLSVSFGLKTAKVCVV